MYARYSASPMPSHFGIDLMKWAVNVCMIRTPVLRARSVEGTRLPASGSAVAGSSPFPSGSSGSE